MAVLRESPWYQEILQQGQQQGLQEGMRQGLLIGIALGLELKFGAEGLQLLPEIGEIEDVGLLKAISQAIKTVNTLEALRQIYITS
jgi:predicted transposase YdaD